MSIQESGQTHAITTAVEHMLFAANVGSSEFSALLRAFGPLPKDGIRELAELLVRGVGVYRLQHLACLPPPAEQAKQLDDISKNAIRLLQSMGVEDHHAVGLDPSSVLSRLHSTAQCHLPVALSKVALDRRPTTAALTASERVTYLAVLLSDLVPATESSAAQVLELSPRRNKRSRGGIGRQGPAAKERLLHDLFDAYAKLRAKYPRSGPDPAYGKPLIAFVRAGLALAVSLPPPIMGPDGTVYQCADMPRGSLDLMKDTLTTDDSIRGAFTRWRAQSTL
jgi:hypothetical protein